MLYVPYARTKGTTESTMKRADLQLSKGMLVLVEHDGYVRRAIVSDTFYLDCPDTTEPRAGMFDAVLGAGAGMGPCGDTPIGEEVEFLPRQVRAVVRLEREATLGTHYDWLAHCRAALEYAETQYAKAPWDQVLGKPWNWAQEAWLGGHAVPCTVDKIEG